jgi:hypothetical protein
MTDETGARVAPEAPSAQLTEQVSVLMTEETRAFLLGSVAADGARGEGAVARALLDTAIEAFRTAQPIEHAVRMKAGRRELELRARRRDSAVS